MADDKLYSLQEVLSIASNMLGKTQTELVALTKEKDLSNIESVISELKTIAIAERKALKDGEFGKGFKKSKTDTEKTIKELFPNLTKEDLEGKELDDILVLVRDKTTTTDKSKTAITTEQAMADPNVKAKIQKLELDAAKHLEKSKEFEDYKVIETVMQRAIAIAEKNGASFSQDLTIRARQIKALRAELSEHNYKFAADGSPIVMDKEGVNPKWNDTDQKPWDFEALVKFSSPVDFGTTTTKPNTTTYTPDASNQGVLNHGYSEAQLKTANLYEERKAALSAGLTAKADFLEKELEKRVMAEEAESKKI